MSPRLVVRESRAIPAKYSKSSWGRTWPSAPRRAGSRSGHQGTCVTKVLKGTCVTKGPAEADADPPIDRRCERLGI